MRGRFTQASRGRLHMLRRTAKGDWSGLLLYQRELAHVDVAVTEQLGAAGQVLHVTVVDHLRLERDRLILVSLQGRGPRVECLGIVRLQWLNPSHREAARGGALAHPLCWWAASTPER